MINEFVAHKPIRIIVSEERGTLRGQNIFRIYVDIPTYSEFFDNPIASNFFTQLYRGGKRFLSEWWIPINDSYSKLQAMEYVRLTLKARIADPDFNFKFHSYEDGWAF